MFRRTTHVLAALALVALSSIAQADPITYTFTGIGTGTVDNTAFTASPFTIIVLGDTANVSTAIFGAGTPAVSSSSSTIAITGVGSGAFTTDKVVFDFQGGSTLGFNEGGGSDLLDLINPGFATYDLTTNFGPITDPAPNPLAVNQFNNIPSTLGSITFTSIVDATFQAQLTSAAVPEPGSIALLTGMGTVGAVFVRRRKQARKAA